MSFTMMEQKPEKGGVECRGLCVGKATQPEDRIRGFPEETDVMFCTAGGEDVQHPQTDRRTHRLIRTDRTRPSPCPSPCLCGWDLPPGPCLCRDPCRIHALNQTCKKRQGACSCPSDFLKAPGFTTGCTGELMETQWHGRPRAPPSGSRANPETDRRLQCPQSFNPGRGLFCHGGWNRAEKNEAWAAPLPDSQNELIIEPSQV